MSAIVWRTPRCEAGHCPRVAVVGRYIAVSTTDNPGCQAYLSVDDFRALLAGDWSAEIAQARASAQEVTGEQLLRGVAG